MAFNSKKIELQETIAVRDGGILFHVTEDKDKEKSILTGRIFMVNHMSKLRPLVVSLYPISGY